ncbi:bifunctional lysylphosphatidylglycerol flippase/synthetase MprF [uncultured Amnibacterium sp.]|uniref:bifunctional lysylphosphatidylglycerol flippase/synthetase MprF n=1 Tax=uncultured Amnibacterium sp. TaxID=1631851 RepID=UPI0035CC4F3F
MTPFLRRRPVSIGFATLLLVLAVATGSAFGIRPGLRDVVGTGLDAVLQRHDLTTLLTAAVFVPGPVVLVLALVAAVLLMGAAEALIGPARTLLVALTTTVAGVLTGIGLQAAGILVRGVWSQAPLDTLVVDPFIPIAGTVLAASAFAGPLWRRRTRVLGLTALVVLLLYSGGPADAYRLCAGLVGLLLGALLTRDRPRLGWRRSSHHEVRSLLAAVVGVVAVGPLVAIVSPHGYGPLRPLGLLFRDALPGTGVLRAPCVPAGDPGFCARQLALAHVNGPGTAVMPILVLAALVAAAWGMWHGRRASAVAAVTIDLLVAALTTVFYGVLPALRNPASLLGPALGDGPTLQTALAAAVPAAVAAVVLASIRHFDVRARRRTLLRCAVAIGAAFAAGGVAYVLAGALLPGQFQPRANALSALADLPRRYVPIGFVDLRHVALVPVGQPAHLVHDWMGPLLWLVVLAVTIVLRFDVARASPADSRRLARLLRVGGGGSVSYMATWPENSTWFSDDGQHAVAYREVGGVALALCEPIGRPDGALPAARAFTVACDDRGLTPVFYAVPAGFARALADDRQWSTVVIGEDTLIDPATVTLTGKRWQDVRSSINRAARLGIRTTWLTWAECTTAQRGQIVALSELWVADRGLPELGFTLGGLDELRDPAVRLMLAVDADGQVLAVTSWLPTWREGTEVRWTLDFMRRAPDGMNGLMEFLIAAVLQLAQERGVEVVSLSASPLSLSAADGDGPLERLLEVLSRVLEPAYGFTSLASFKAKFQPALQPLVLAYPDPVALPSTGLALTRAYLPHLTARAAVRLVSAFR